MQLKFSMQKRDQYGNLDGCWIWKRISGDQNRGRGVCFVREKNHSLSIRAKVWHLVVPLTKNNITRQGVTQTLNKGAILLASRSDDGAQPWSLVSTPRRHLNSQVCLNDSTFLKSPFRKRLLQPKLWYLYLLLHPSSTAQMSITKSHHSRWEEAFSRPAKPQSRAYWRYWQPKPPKGASGKFYARAQTNLDQR